MRDRQTVLLRRFEGQCRDFRTLFRREIFFSPASFGILQPGQDQAFVPDGPQCLVGEFPISVLFSESVSPTSDEVNFEVVLGRDVFILAFGRGGEYDLKALFHERWHGAFVEDFL